MSEIRRLTKYTVKAISQWLLRHLANREVLFVTALLICYAFVIGGALLLKHLRVLSVEEFISMTIVASCVTFCFTQFAFLSRTKSLDKSLQIKSAACAMIEQMHVDDECIDTYVRIGKSKADIIGDVRVQRGAAPGTIKALSLLSMESCLHELQKMMDKKRIERFGNHAHILTQKCYGFASHSIRAIALTDDASLRFWIQSDGIGRTFYQCNRAALERGVPVSRYFHFTSQDIRAFDGPTDYRDVLIAAIEEYIKQLPNSELFLVLRDDWFDLYPEKTVEDRRAKANRKFKSYYAQSFPDVSLFDDTVASLWKGASSEKIDDVRIAWDPYHLVCVKDVFDTVLQNRRTIACRREKDQTARELIECFSKKIYATGGLVPEPSAN